MPLSVFNLDVSFIHHFLAIYLTAPSHPVGVLVILDMPVNLSKMVGNLAI